MKVLLSITALLISLSASAQGNLQFNQVKLVTTAEAVPAGKVWKVENVLPTEIYTYGSNNPPLIYEILVNGNIRKIGHASWTDSNQNATESAFIMMPIWLPAGTTLSASSNVGEISVIEFNVVP